MRSHEPINVSNQEGQDEIPEGKPRKRKTFMSGYGSRSEDGDAPSSVEDGKDVPDKQKFTAVGQLKATLFNSWMNLLLIAAPVGSKLRI
jgi:Ca2+:H+ antiporter